MSLLSLPMSVANHIEKRQCDFVGVRIGEEFKYHSVSWSKVCSPISEDGLGIKNLLRFNHSLLGNLLWCYGLERYA